MHVQVKFTVFKVFSLAQRANFDRVPFGCTEPSEAGGWTDLGLRWTNFRLRMCPAVLRAFVRVVRLACENDVRRRWRLMCALPNAVGS